jgi:hypothetical protein
MGPKRNFKNYGAYRRWLSYDKIHVNPEPSKSPVQVTIAGKPHHVNHCPHCHLENGNRCGEHCGR